MGAGERVGVMLSRVEDVFHKVADAFAAAIPVRSGSDRVDRVRAFAQPAMLLAGLPVPKFHEFLQTDADAHVILRVWSAYDCGLRLTAYNGKGSNCSKESGQSANGITGAEGGS